MFSLFFLLFFGGGWGVEWGNNTVRGTVTRTQCDNHWVSLLFPPESKWAPGNEIGSLPR